MHACVQVYVCVCSHRDQKRLPGPVELELQAFAQSPDYFMGPRSELRPWCSMPLATDVSLVPTDLLLRKGLLHPRLTSNLLCVWR